MEPARDPSPLVPLGSNAADAPLERAYRYLYSDANRYGSVLGLIGVALLFGGIIGKGWLLIVAGLYAIGALAAPRRSLDVELQPEQTPTQLQERLDGIVSSVRAQLKAEAAVRLDSIREIIGALLPRLGSAVLSEEDAFTVRECVFRYLPESLAYFFKLPAMYRRLHVIRDGKTAEALLDDQLVLIESRLKDALDRACQAEAQGLLAQGRFLEDKFQKPTHLKAV